jgi:Ca2+-binding RTX toxin-like protein
LGDVINGGIGKDAIYALGGNDVIRGGADGDVIQAGAGDDVIQITGTEGVGDMIKGGETGETFGDVLQVLGSGPVTLSGFNASTAEIEVWQGNGQALLGNTSSNIFDLSGLVQISGLSGVDAGEGNDTLVSSSSSDTFTGGLGNDAFVFKPNFGHDVVTDFNGAGALVGDVIKFDHTIFSSFADVQAHASDASGHVVITDVNGNQVELTNVSFVTNLHSNDFSFI